MIYAGLRKLTLSALLYLGCNNVNMAHSGLQLGPLGWSVNFKSFFDSGQKIVQAGSEAFAVPRVLAQGTRPAFEQVTLIALLCYVAQGIAVGGFLGGSSLAQTLLYGASFVLVQATGGVCQTAIRVMVVKQGIECTDAGRAELNAVRNTPLSFGAVSIETPDHLAKTGSGQT